MKNKHIEELLLGNREWSRTTRDQHPEFFEQLATGQAPRYLWVGCSDSRVPATEICGLKPGSVFVHRNIANLALPSDPNFMAVLEYAVDVLKVEDILVCGHYDCGGVRAALEGCEPERVDRWLQPLRQLADQHSDALASCSASERNTRLSEWNVIQQVRNISGTSIVGEAWNRGQQLGVHALIYRVADGVLHDLGGTVVNGEGHGLETPDGQAL